MSDIMVAMMGAEVPSLKAEHDLCVVDFLPQCINWCDFLTIFYFCSNTFKIKQYLSCYLLNFITFNRQVESSCDTQLKYSLSHEDAERRNCIHFDLSDAVVCKWKSELAEGKNCEINTCSLIKLQKALLKLQTLDNFQKICNLKVEALSRSELVSSILRSLGANSDKHYEPLVLTVSVQLSPESGDLSPMLFNFKFEIADILKFKGYAKMLCACDANCPRIECVDKCPCKPPPRPPRPPCPPHFVPVPGPVVPGDGHDHDHLADADHEHDPSVLINTQIVNNNNLSSVTDSNTIVASAADDESFAQIGTSGDQNNDSNNRE